MSRRDTGFSREVKNLVYDRAGGCCELCGKHTADLQYHHRRPRGSGGTLREDTNYASNCLLLCAADHSRIETRERRRARNNGWLVDQNQDPAVTPVFLRGRFVLLSVAGDVQEVAA